MTYDFAPLLRTAIGFDRFARLADTASVSAVPGGSYPPYNIGKFDNDRYRLTMAVAGFGPNDIEITLSDNHLIIKGTAPTHLAEGETLHRGIAARAFERRFALADHIVIGEASLVNGLLTIDIRHVLPEAPPPRRIAIQTPEVVPSPNSRQDDTAQQNAA